MAESSYATRVFPGGPQAPSEESLDPETLARLRAQLRDQSPAQGAQALREITPTTPDPTAPWRTIPYPEVQRFDPVKSWAKWRASDPLLNPPPGDAVPPVGKFDTPENRAAWEAHEQWAQEALGSGGPIGVGALGRGAGALKPKWRLQSGQERASIPKYPDFDEATVKRYFETGAKDPKNLNWYTEGQKAGEWMAGEEEPLLRYFGSIFSQRKAPIPETNLAMKAFRAWKERGIEGLRQLVGPSIHQRGELVRGALTWENNPNTDLAKNLTPGSMKRRSYYGARGDVDESVIDTHAGNVATRGRFKPDDPLDYYGVQHGYHELADKAGVPRRGYQAAVWVPWREEQAALRGVPAGDPSPASRILLQQSERNPDWQALVRAGKVPTPPTDWRTKLLYGALGTAGAGSIAEQTFGEDR